MAVSQSLSKAPELLDEYAREGATLVQERARHWRDWQELARWINPARGRFLQTDPNIPNLRNPDLLNDTALEALKVARAGMVSGLTSRTRPWFRLIFAQPNLNDKPAVKRWLYATEGAMREVQQRSNLYNALPLIYADILQFGTGCAIIDEDDHSVMRVIVQAPGTYAVGSTLQGQIDVFYREFRMTVGQLVRRFGNAVGPRVLDQYRRGNFHQWLDVRHIIRPRAMRDRAKADRTNMPFASCYWLRSHDGAFLEEGGYRTFPVVCPRWDLNVEEFYGTGPGHHALATILSLQSYEAMDMRAVELNVDPPVGAPPEFEGRALSMLPGEVNIYKGFGGDFPIKPLIAPNNNLADTERKIQRCEQQIKGHFLYDLFRKVSDMAQLPETARLVEELHEEKVSQLAPNLERLHDELLDKLIDRQFDIQAAQGMIPEAPDELIGQPLAVEYVSILAQAYKRVGLSDIERWVGFGTQLAEVAPEVLYRYDFAAIAKAHGEMLSVPPTLMRPDDEVEALKQAAAAQARIAALAQMGPPATESIKNLAQSPVQPGNALGRLLSQPPAASA